MVNKRTLLNIATTHTLPESSYIARDTVLRFRSRKTRDDIDICTSHIIDSISYNYSR